MTNWSRNVYLSQDQAAEELAHLGVTKLLILEACEFGELETVPLMDGKRAVSCQALSEWLLLLDWRVSAGAVRLASRFKSAYARDPLLS